MRIAVLVKQVPHGESMALENGRLVREGLELEVNAYCRRANAKAVELAGSTGEVVVFTMGPPAAEEALREMIACGATRGVHICDPELGGSDTLVTSRVIGAAIHAEGPFDLVLCGLNSIDADTGQVPPQVAELLDLPFVAAARHLELGPDERSLVIETETDSSCASVRVSLPAVVSAAERLTDPSKAAPDARAAVSADRIVRRTARDLGFRSVDVGAGGSPTRVGKPVTVEVQRRGVRASTVSEAFDLVTNFGGFTQTAPVGAVVPEATLGDATIWVVLDDPNVGHELLGRAADLAEIVGGTVTAYVGATPAVELGAYGADRVVVLEGTHAEPWAEQMAAVAEVERPRIVLVHGTVEGRSIASKISARHGWGLTGDGISVDATVSGELTVWKPALGGRLVAPITSTSSTQVATIRPGVLPERSPRHSVATTVPWSGRIRNHTRVVVDDSRAVDRGRAELAGAPVVVAVGQGVDPADYGLLLPLVGELDAVLGATRKVTDRGWMPRSRQIGITGLAVTPRLFVSVGASGRYNHACGFAAAGVVLAINADPHAEIFSHADVGLVGDWRPIVAELTDLVAARAASGVAPQAP